MGTAGFPHISHTNAPGPLWDWRTRPEHPLMCSFAVAPSGSRDFQIAAISKAVKCWKLTWSAPEGLGAMQQTPGAILVHVHVRSGVPGWPVRRSEMSTVTAKGMQRARQRKSER